MHHESDPVLSKSRFDAVIFDLDGVITDTAKTHFHSWKEVFDEFLLRSIGEPFEPFTESDYRSFVDGRPRFDGIRSFLGSRNIELSEGEASEKAGFNSIQALGMEKNRRYRQRLQAGEISVFDDAIALLEQLRKSGFRMGLVSSSRNAKLVLETLELESHFQARVDGTTLADTDLRGKPAPDMFLEAAQQLNVTVDRAVVVEDAVSGVEAGRAGGFGLVVGRGDTEDDRRQLVESGADFAVHRLSELRLE